MDREFKHFTSEEIHLSDRDPNVASDPQDKPAGAYARIQRRRWKLWINFSSGAMWHRKSLLVNDWSPVPLGSGGTSGNVRFGATVPSVLGTDSENDTYIQTSNGLSSGTFVGHWVFDQTSATWVQSGVQTVLTDNANGTLTINAGGANLQDTIRPVSELTDLVGPIDLTADRILLLDQSAAAHRRISPTALATALASTVLPLSDGLANDTTNRTGAIGTATLFSRQDHRHPIERITTVPAFPGVTVDAQSSGLTVSSNVLYTTEETITFQVQVTITPTTAGAWRTVNFNNIAGYTVSKRIYNNTYNAAKIGGTGYPDMRFLWAGTTFYYAPLATSLNACTHNFFIEFTLT